MQNLLFEHCVIKVYSVVRKLLKRMLFLSAITCPSKDLTLKVSEVAYMGIDQACSVKMAGYKSKWSSSLLRNESRCSRGP